MPARLLIVNADDIGMTEPVTDAIVDCHRDGIVTSATLMANMPAAEYAARRAKECPELGIGLHLNLSEGFPLSPLEEVRDLVDGEGRFLPLSRQIANLWSGRDRGAQVETELRRQVERALELGIRPTHFDSHHGVQKRPLVRRAILRLARRYGIPAARTHLGGWWYAADAPAAVRARCALRNAAGAHRQAMLVWNHHVLRRGGLKTPDRKLAPHKLLPIPAGPKERLVAALVSLPEGVTEILSHPGYAPDAYLAGRENHLRERVADARLMTDRDVRSAVERAGIRLVHFGHL